MLRFGCLAASAAAGYSVANHTWFSDQSLSLDVTSRTKYTFYSLLDSVSASLPKFEITCFAKEPEKSASTSLSPLASRRKLQGSAAYREQRFLDFASLEHNGIPYMSPQDFLESVTQDSPRHRKIRKQLSNAEVDKMLHVVPSRWWSSGNKRLFRDMYTEGLVSYSEYLFLLCVISKPESGFQIAFKMIDLDCDNSLVKEEFVILNRMMSGDSEEDKQDDLQDTSLMRYFFGKSGKDKLTFDDFRSFMDCFQTEVLEMEFMEYSKGLNTISETEFAKILLRYTKLSDDEKVEYISRIYNKVMREEGIPFDEFRKFFQFLNSLQDFSLAMKMYTLAGEPINQEEFQRAVKACVGYTLHPHLVSTVFLLFDKDNDGNLSYHEFLNILHDRLHGLNSRPLKQDTNWESFQRCVSRKLKEESA